MGSIINKYFCPLALFALTLTIASIFSTLGVDPHHQGIMFKPAFDVAHGQMLFRDTFTQYGALTTLLHAWALRIFGDYLLVIQIETALFYGLISLLLYYLWLQILPKWLATTSVLIWLFIAPFYRPMITFLPWSSVPALLFQLFSLLLVLHALRKDSWLMMLLAGGVAVLTFWCRQPVGVLHCAALLFFIGTAPLFDGNRKGKAKTDCVFFITGILVASLPFIIWLLLNQALNDMYLQSLKGAFFFGTTTYQEESQTLGMNILMSLAAYDPKADHFNPLWSLMPFICLILLAIIAFKRWIRPERIGSHLPVYGLLLVSIASWMQYFPVPCLKHCFWAATPMIGILSYSAWHSSRFFSVGNKSMQILITCVALTYIFQGEIKTNFFNGRVKASILKTKIEEPRVLRGMLTSPRMAAKYKTISTALNRAVASESPSYLVNFSADALYLTFIGPQMNFHPMYIDWGRYNNFIYPDYKKNRNDFIYKKRPLILRKEEEIISGWNYVEIFDVTEITLKRDYYEKARRLALYRYVGYDEAH